eukprot:3060279-Pyramimonas_sp.AAC.1
MHRMSSSMTTGSLSTSSVSSAYTRSGTAPLGTSGIRLPCMRWASARRAVITITNRNGERGQPWHMP